MVVKIYNAVLSSVFSFYMFTYLLPKSMLRNVIVYIAHATSAEYRHEKNIGSFVKFCLSVITGR